MMPRTEGLHHVTAIADDPQTNIDFYVTVLGLRLVKRTVNFDDPSTYHLYYGDSSGTPGTLMTFFPWQKVPTGRIGVGQSTATAFSIPQGSLGWWRGHLTGLGVDSTITGASDGERLVLRDPDGLRLELVASSVVDPRNPWDSASVPGEHAIRGQHSSVLTVEDGDRTVATLVEDLGMRVESELPDRTRLRAGPGGPGHLVDVVTDSRGEQGVVAGGTVHHIAFRVPDHATQELWRAHLVDRGHHVTKILDRQYFTSIYFREPGGVLLEVATDTPGFDVDEPLLELGRALKLPPWLEPDREDIERSVRPVTVPRENGPD